MDGIDEFNENDFFNQENVCALGRGLRLNRNWKPSHDIEENSRGSTQIAKYAHQPNN